MASPALAPAPADFDLESLRQGPGLLGELERLAARWSVSPPFEQPFAWPKAVDAPPELKAFYAIAHYWPGARLYGSQDFLRPLGRLARDGGKLTFITENQGNFRIALEANRGSWTLWACAFGQDWLWVPMDGVRLPELLVTLRPAGDDVRLPLPDRAQQPGDRALPRRGRVRPALAGRLRRRQRMDLPLAPVRRDRRQAGEGELVLVRPDAARSALAVPGRARAEPAPDARPT